MGWLDHQDSGTSAKTKKVSVVAPELDICLDDEHWLPVNKNCVDKICTDDMPRLLIVVDEIAELTGKSGIKTTEGKAEDALKDLISEKKRIKSFEKNIKELNNRNLK